MSYASRVTIDLDAGQNLRLRVLRAYYGLARLADSVDVRVSSSGKGVHLIGWFENRLTDETQQRLRESLCDDPNRIALDEMRRGVGHTTGVLWDPAHECESVHEALALVDTATPMAERFAADVKRGLVR